MKVDENVRKELIENLKEWATEVQLILSQNKKIKEASSVEEIMQRKRDLLITYTRALPLGSTYCYFCLETQRNCEECPYREAHQECLGKTSDFRWIVKKQKELLDALESYYKGEQYS